MASAQQSTGADRAPLTLPIRRVSSLTSGAYPAPVAVAATPTNAAATPLDRASTAWRTRVCPLAPNSRVAQASSPMSCTSATSRPLPQPIDVWATPTGSMSIRGFGEPPAWEQTPSNAESAAWHAQAACYAPVRGDRFTLSSSASSTPMASSSSVSSWPAVRMLGSSFSTVCTPVALAAPEPRRLIPRGIDTSAGSLLPSPGNTPLNTGFIATPGSRGGLPAFFDASSPFFGDITPIAAQPEPLGRSVSLSSTFGHLQRLPLERCLSDSAMPSPMATPAGSQRKQRRMQTAFAALGGERIDEATTDEVMEEAARLPIAAPSKGEEDSAMASDEEDMPAWVRDLGA